MNTARATRIPVLLILALLLVICKVASAGSEATERQFSAAWQQIDTLDHLGLTASALAAVEKVYQSAKREKAADQVVRALLYEARLQSDKEEAAASRTIGRFESEIAASRGPLANILHSITAELYWKYYQLNGRRIATRTPVPDADAGDLATWDMTKILGAVLRHYDASVNDADSIGKVPISAFSGLLADTGCHDTRRPTLYDFLAHRAFDFLIGRNSSSLLPLPPEEFNLDSPIYFSDFDTFARAPIATPDSLSFKFHALRIIRDLIAFHEKDGNIYALVDADLTRLDSARLWSNLEDKEQLYVAALKRLCKKVEQSPAAADVMLKIVDWDVHASLRYKPGFDTTGRWLRREAVQLCDTATARYGNDPRAVLCKIYKDWILVGRLKFETEEYEAPGKPFRILLKWNDIDRATIRIVPLRDSIESPDAWGCFGVSGDSILRWLTTHPPIAQWSVALPDSGDHQIHSAEIPMPPLAIGSYAIVVCTDSTFTDPRSALAGGSIRISSISFLSRMPKDTSIEIYVRDRETGKPLHGAIVKRLKKDASGPDDKGSWAADCIDTADREGRVALQPDLGEHHRRRDVALEITAGKDRIFSSDGLDPGGFRFGQPPGPGGVRTQLFTDRSIYRPGQTIYFKGIILQSDGDTDAIVPLRKEEITLYDANSRIIATQYLTSNQYGTLSGSFIAPLEGLRGTMQIKSELRGQAGFSVEEYKRPKFEVTLHLVQGQFKLNTLVTVTGQAKTYAGAPLDHALISYGITRRGCKPGWVSWYRPYSYSGTKRLVPFDSVRTDDTGGFSITFNAVPDRSVPESENPAFVYTVHVEATDAGGETRGATANIFIGYRALDLSVALPQYVNKLSDTAFPIKALTRSGRRAAASGTVRIFRLRQPDRPVRERSWQRPDILMLSRAESQAAFPDLPYGGEDSFVNLPRDTMVLEQRFDTKTEASLSLSNVTDWPQGMYVAEASAVDTFGGEVTSTQYFLLYSPKEKTAAAPLGDIFIPVKKTGEPGEEAAFIIGSGYRNVEALFEVMNKGNIVKKEWLSFSNSQKLVEIPIKEEYRGNFDVHFAFIRNGRSYTFDSLVNVPWRNKGLKLTFESFRDKLLPDRKEEWRIKIRGPGGEKVAAEMAAELYDASLDDFRLHNWSFNPYYHSSQGFPTRTLGAPFATANFTIKRDPDPTDVYPVRCYPALNWFGFSWRQWETIAREGQIDAEARAPGVFGSAGGFGGGSGLLGSADLGAAGGSMRSLVNRRKWLSAPEPSDTGQPEPDVGADFSLIHPRANLDETAFFYPQLLTNDSGEVVISFTAPEALTRWKMLGLALTRDLKHGTIEKQFVTQKPLMVMPSLPRFLREKDSLSIAATVDNLSDSAISGSASLMFFDALTMEPLDSAFGNRQAVRTFAIEKRRSGPCSWKITVPAGAPPVVVRIVAKAGDFSDGEDNVLPIAGNRALVTEALPLPVNGPQTKKFTFARLLASGHGSPSLQSHRLTLEFTQNPAWYAVEALPCLMENGVESSEGLFSRYYANTMASSIANSSPRIKAVFDAWKLQGGDALLSNLDKSRELKSALLEETPWVLDGKDETERKHRVAVLFDLNRMAYEGSTSLAELEKMQIPETGAWPWFPGLPPDRFVTQYILTGLGRLRHLAMLDFDPSGKSRAWQSDKIRSMVESGLNYLDGRIRADYDTVLRHQNPDSNHLSPDQVQYLYARSYFTDYKFTDSNRVAFYYYNQQAIKYWMYNNRYLQGMLALALHRLGETTVPDRIIRSLRENALHSEEMGMYWKELTEGYCWYGAPIETQALYIEAFDEVAHDSAAVGKMKLWLLKNKQTTGWPSSRATADACYALLMRGNDLLSDRNDVAVTLGRVTVDAAKLPADSLEAGTGYLKTSWSGLEIKPDMGAITVSKPSSGTAWGAVYWQYFEDLDKITPAASPLALSRKFFIKRDGDRGARLEPLSKGDRVRIADKVTVRIELTVECDLEYVHMKDPRAAGFEPFETLSGCHWQDGLGYYRSTRDLSTDFFFSLLRKGRYVFEYDLEAAHKGDFSTGITSIQCMYAPEFEAHSAGGRIVIKD